MLGIYSEVELEGLGRAGSDPLSLILASTRQYGPEIQKLFAELRLPLPRIVQPSAAVQQAVAKILVTSAAPAIQAARAPVERARKVAAEKVKGVVQRHEAQARRRISEGASKLQRAGVPRQEVARRVKSAVEKLPSSVAKKAVEEQKKTGRVSQATQAALNKAKEPIKREIEKAAAPAKAAVQSEANKLLQSLPPAARGAAAQAAKSLAEGRLDVNALKQLGKTEGKRLLESYGKKYGAQALSKLAPDLKIPGGVSIGAAADLLFSGKKITAERALQAGYGVAKGAAEKAIAAQTGFPVYLPAKFTAKEIGKSFANLIPTNLNQLIDTGLAVGGQYAASALTAALAGSAIGSVIPGLGTVIGIGVALGINALKGALKEKPPPYMKSCPTKAVCPTVPNLSPMELLPWIATNLASVHTVIAQDRKRSYCGKGQSVECMYRLNVLERNVYDLIYPFASGSTGSKRSWEKSTPAVLGLPQVESLIRIYAKAPRSHAWYQDNPKFPGYKTITQEPNQRLIDILGLLNRRKAILDSIVSRSKRVSTMTPNELERYRSDLGAEMQNAMMQYSFTPGRETEQWVGKIGEMWTALVGREAAIQAETQRRYGQDLKRQAELRKQGKLVTYKID
jgi:hypothetical protein